MTERKFRAEYAEFGQTMCKGCTFKIEQNNLRISISLKDKFLDETTSDWYHAKCFFIYVKLNTIEQVSNLDNIRWKDREYIRRKIEDQVGIFSNYSFCDPKYFKIDYSPSNTTGCFGCFSPILKDNMRIIKEVVFNDDETATEDEEIIQYEYYHLDCFKNLRRNLGFYEAGSKLSGYYGKLWLAHRQQVTRALPEVNEPERAKALEAYNREKLMKKQNYELFRVIDEIKKFSKEDMIGLLESSRQFVPECTAEIIETLADQLVFGTLPLCLSCYQFRFVFESGVGYQCMGTITEWTRCNNVITNPTRTKFIIPDEYKNKYEFLKLYEPKKETRVINISSLSTVVAEDNKFQQQFGKISSPVLFNCNTMQDGLSINKSFIGRKNKLKLRIKSGGAVDPDSKLVDIASIYHEGHQKFSVTLGLTDIEANKNNYFKIQILEHDNEETFWLFSSWGRIGTSIGDTNIKKLPLEACIAKFKELYEKKTGNKWENHNNFVKKPGMYLALNTEDTPKYNNNLFQSSKITSKLSKPVQDLIALIFNVESMKDVMREYELDIDKMPLGALSRKQLGQACQVLNELAKLILTNDTNPLKLIDASNRFYTLVPHSFGLNGPPVLSTIQAIKNKCEMLSTLMDMAVSYHVLNAEIDASKNPVDAYYEQLNTEITVLSQSSPEYEMIKKYVKNTHSANHKKIKLSIDRIFVVKRKGEEERYQQFSQLHNKRLLWHGSRITNFAGILSQGLRIAPPEAPSHGYMFGKGIYFADMVSKSANYCSPNSSCNRNKTGLLLLCEVALGTMYQRTSSYYINQLPSEYQSTWGIGNTTPDPNDCYVTQDNVLVPYGKPVKNLDAGSHSSLLHNEYIVYNPNQVKVKYLVRMNFQYNHIRF